MSVWLPSLSPLPRKVGLVDRRGGASDGAFNWCSSGAQAVRGAVSGPFELLGRSRFVAADLGKPAPGDPAPWHTATRCEAVVQQAAAGSIRGHCPPASA